MKRTFLTTAALILCTGAATAEVTVSGDGRLGFKYIEDRVQQASRARIKFTLKAEADNGVEYGGSFRADQAAKAKAGAEGDIYVSGKYGKISFGNNDSASYKANGDLHHIFLIGDDDQEFQFFAADATDDDNPNVLYEFNSGSTTFYASALDGDAPGKKPKDYEDARALGITHDTDRYRLGFGVEQGTSYEIEYEKDKDGNEDKDKIKNITELDNIRATVSAEIKFTSYKVKAIVSTGEKGDEKIHQFGGSAEYVLDDLTVAAFLKQQREPKTNINFGGIGASYKLNEHATVKGGIARRTGGDAERQPKTYADLGITLNF